MKTIAIWASAMALSTTIAGAAAEAKDLRPMFENACVGHPIDAATVAAAARADGMVSPPEALTKLLEKIPQAQNVAMYWQAWEGGFAIVARGSASLGGGNHGDFCVVASIPTEGDAFGPFIDAHHLGAPMPFNFGKLPPGAKAGMVFTIEDANGAQKPVTSENDPAVGPAVASGRLHVWLGVTFEAQKAAVLLRFDVKGQDNKAEPRSH